MPISCSSDCLFAPSSAYFAQCHAVRYTPRETLEITSNLGSNMRRFWRRKGQTMVFSVSPHGVLAKIPLMKDGDEVYGYLGWSTNGAPLFLQLGVSLGARDSSTAIPSYRCVRVAKLSQKCIKHATWKWKEVYIQAQQLEDSLVDAAPVCVSGMSFNYGYYSPFHFLQAHAPDRPIPTRKDRRYRLDNGFRSAQSTPGCIWLDSAKTPPLPWTGIPPAEFTLTCEGTSFVLSLGLCTIRHSHSSKQSLQHWANIRLSRIRGERLRRSKSDHDCLTDHISAWPDRTRTVTLKTDEHFRFTLAFTRCMVNPTHTLDLDISSDRPIAFTSDGNPYQSESARSISSRFNTPSFKILWTQCRSDEAQLACRMHKEGLNILYTSYDSSRTIFSITSERGLMM
ncbi:hypothetical protein C8Q80DRAFT_910934 [Daedaleopsis nitida]|nr:hypothetical protein C8Q80DRAFT_910934 [Daedaleopsis nitida]